MCVKEQGRESEGAKMGAVVSGKIVENKWMGILKEQIFKLASAAKAARRKSEGKENRKGFLRRKSRRKKHF